MKIVELASAMTGQPMGADPVQAIDDAIKQKENQRRALDKEIADLRAQKPQAMKAKQQAQAQQVKQPQQTGTPSTTQPSSSNDGMRQASAAIQQTAQQMT